MTSPPLPREGATPSQVRLAAWHHAHRAHDLLLEGDAVTAASRGLTDHAARHDMRLSGERLARRAAQHAAVAQALLAAIATSDPGRVPHA
jgi:hypothetical protein